MLGSTKQELLNRGEGDSDTDYCTTAQTASLHSYDEVVNELLATYADNSSIAPTDDTIISPCQR